MKRFLATLALVVPAVGFQAAAAPTIIGDLNNFDTLNDTGQVCYGFEIEIDDIHSTDITYTFDWNHYGAPKIREDNTDPAHPKVFVRYESTKDAAGRFGANGSLTNPVIPTITPPQGHTCTDPTVNEGCEHFGVGYYGAPTVIKYNWLVDGGAGSLVYYGTPVNVGTPTWTYTPPASGLPAQVVAAIPAPAAPIQGGKQYGEPSWVKVIKTTAHNANPIELRDLISDDADHNGLADWQNNEPDEIETEWKLLQVNNAGNAAKDELQGMADDMGDGSETVTRRYEFYRYGADPNTLDGETGEAMCSEVNATTDPANPDYLHGIGTNVAVTDPNGDTYYVDCAAQVVVGPYIGAQMAGFAAAMPLGLIDHLQDGDSGVAYTPRSVAVGGAPPYTITILSGSLPPGLSIGGYADPQAALIASGVLWGTPASGGDFPFTVGVQDSNGAYATQAYSLHISGLGAPQVDLVVAKTGSGTGDVTGNGLACGANCSTHLDAGTVVSLSATPAAGSIFTGWSGPCTGTGACSFTLSANSTVTATFTKQWQLSVSQAGSGNGSVTVNGVDCGGTCSVSLDENTAVALRATAGSGSFFTGWSGACTGTEPCNLTMTADQTVVATFVPTSQQFALDVTTTGAGTVVSSPNGIRCGKQCSQSYPVGTPVTLSIKITKKELFLGWTGACAPRGTQTTCTLLMLDNQLAGATFR